MVEELAVRSEHNSLESLDKTFNELMVVSDADTEATLLVLINELYADSACRCEEKEAAYGNESEEAASCHRAVGKTRDQMLQLYRTFCDKLRGEHIG